MRWLITTLMLAAAFSGCLEGDEPETPATPDTETAETALPPEDFSADGSFMAGHDPYNFVGGEPCSQPQSACEFVPFSTEVTTSVAAVLSWTNPANDLDLYLFTADGQEVSREGINFVGEPPSTEHRMPAVSIAPGDYEFYVVAWNAAAESWTLDVSFT